MGPKEAAGEEERLIFGMTEVFEEAGGKFPEWRRSFDIVKSPLATLYAGS